MGLSRTAPLLRLADGLSETAGRIAAVGAIALVLLVAGLVLARYGFGLGSVAAQEAVLWLHASIFLLGLAYALRHGGHVRVDVFSQRWSPRTRAWVEVGGGVLLLLPLCVFIVAMSWDYVAASWAASATSTMPTRAAPTAMAGGASGAARATGRQVRRAAFQSTPCRPGS